MGEAQPMNDLLTYAGIIGATFILEDPTTIAVGSMINLGKITFQEGFIALFIGIVLGDLGLYGVGRLFARKRKFFVPRLMPFQDIKKILLTQSQKKKEKSKNDMSPESFQVRKHVLINIKIFREEKGKDS